MALKRLWPDDVYVRANPFTPGKKVYTQVIKATAIRAAIHVAGTMSFDRDGRIVGEGDMRRQVRTILENIGRSLAAAGAAASDVVRTKTYVTDMEAYLRDGHAEYLDFFGGELPVSTLIGVSRLTDPRCLVEIETYAEIE
ncbi:MAG: Rid family hydrolase [Candidatus Binataceae bacterium]